ncbi:hypothetical protein LshimejAT787_0310550 [Lyophyllum shimeji]|uniref:Glycosyl transferase family 25 domain-containing protein n=1 Tax=Lyophyllum shimeji TaxID=47721 RepID=A0A9P3PJT4_LYOSH|nr:hypothetical protein LshimejAT787_0310550 [Lyophyllum shimeji]
MFCSALPSSRSIVLLIVLAVSVLVILKLLLVDEQYLLGIAPLYESEASDQRVLHRNQTLGVASKIYVLSLPMRDDRRQDMEHLRKTLDLHWSYIEAIDAENPIVETIMNSVRLIRETYPATSSFTWPDDLPPPDKPMDPWSPGFLSPTRSVDGQATAHKPMPCATQNNSIVPYTPDLPEHKILTASRVACWYSHISVISTIANDDTLRGDDAVIVLEDDVDMERDISHRLRRVWSSLPAGWDIVYLGHCWSDESINLALDADGTFSVTNGTFPVTHIHPSRSPLCTHAYALSRTGARRLLVHLRYPPFAYSRAIDKAISWLIESGRLKSFSIVPSIVVQRKAGKSDIMSGKGSTWRASLVNGIFGN